jgi:hypothetical protein
MASLGVLALPHKILGSVITTNHLFEGVLPILRVLTLPLSLLGSVIVP